MDTGAQAFGRTVPGGQEVVSSVHFLNKEYEKLENMHSLLLQLSKESTYLYKVRGLTRRIDVIHDTGLFVGVSLVGVPNVGVTNDRGPGLFKINKSENNRRTLVKLKFIIEEGNKEPCNPLLACQEWSVTGDSAHLHRCKRRRQEPPNPERAGGHARPELRQAAAELTPEGVRSCTAGNHR